MSVRVRAIVALVVAVIAAMGMVVSWLAASTTVEVSAVLAGEPSKSSVVYEPTLIALSLLLAAVAGVLAVVGVAHLRHR